MGFHIQHFLLTPESGNAALVSPIDTSFWHQVRSISFCPPNFVVYAVKPTERRLHATRLASRWRRECQLLAERSVAMAEL